MIVVQPFFPTTDPRVVGINPVPNIDERIKKLTKELGASNPDTLYIGCEKFPQHDVYPVALGGVL